MSRAIKPTYTSSRLDIGEGTLTPVTYLRLNIKIGT